jgi:hypothetical protein
MMMENEELNVIVLPESISLKVLKINWKEVIHEH